MTDDLAEALARQFHERYETLAPSYNYQTREASARPWASVPPENKALMIETCRPFAQVLAEKDAEIERLRKTGDSMAEFLEVFITDKAANPPTLDAMAHYLKAWRKDDQ